MSTDAIQANLQHHANLLSQLSSLDYAPSALAQQDDYISTVKTELSRVTESITKLSKKTSTMSKEAQDLKDSAFVFGQGHGSIAVLRWDRRAASSRIY